MDEVKILITGGNGYIAKSLYSAFSCQYQVTSITRNDFDLSDNKQVCSWFDTNQYDVVIHTAISGGSRLQEDDQTAFDKNMKMFSNLVQNKHRFSKLISFGSGAELFHGDTPYANSKREIAKQIQELDQFYNLRIFAVFDEDELNTRFIKSNIIRYIKKEPIVIHKNKVMDFFYMKDLVSLVNYYIKTETPPKTINCSYEQKYTLSNIANKINNLLNHKIDIEVQQPGLDFYCGEYTNVPVTYNGLDKGIVQSYFGVKTKQNIHITKDLYNVTKNYTVHDC